METKHTPGPLTVIQPEKFPFPIQIVNAKGDIVFSEGRHSYSTKHKSVADVMCAKGIFDKNDPGLQQKCIDANERQLADAFIRAAAPELLEALKKAVEDCEFELSGGGQICVDIESMKATIAKSTGSASC